jgi:DNA-binding response OmpR family regulator
MCILVVEDDFLVRLVLAEELEREGFVVCQAENGDQAMVLLQNPPATFTLLITDIHMPGRLNGLNVARQMRRRHPEVPIIYTTGRPEALDGFDLLGAKEALVQKPYAPADVLIAVRQLLDTDGGNSGS